MHKGMHKQIGSHQGTQAYLHTDIHACAHMHKGIRAHLGYRKICMLVHANMYRHAERDWSTPGDSDRLMYMHKHAQEV